jgi:hypothetical protein
MIVEGTMPFGDVEKNLRQELRMEQKYRAEFN